MLFLRKSTFRILCFHEELVKPRAGIRLLISLRTTRRKETWARALLPAPTLVDPRLLPYRLDCERPLLTSTLISTRRFSARPSVVALSATGFSEPYPNGCTRRRKGRLYVVTR